MQDSWIDQNEIDELLGSFKGAGSRRGLRPGRDLETVAGLGGVSSPPSGSTSIISPEANAPDLALKPVAAPVRGYIDGEESSDPDPGAYPVRSSFWEDDLDIEAAEATTSPSERDAAKAALALGEARRRADESQLLKVPSVALSGDSGSPPAIDLLPSVSDESLPPPLPDILAGHEPSPMTAPNIPATLGDKEVAMSRRIASLLEQVRSELSPRFIAITDDKGFHLHGDDILNRGHTPEPRDVFQTQRFFGDHAEEVVQICDGAGWWYIRIPALWPHGQVSWQMETREPVEMTSARRFAKLLADTMFPVNANRAG
jgi:hypothetical protein